MNRELFAKSLAASIDIPAGSVISEKMIKIMGPGKGLPTSRKEELIGCVLQRDVLKDSFFFVEDIENGIEAIDTKNLFL